MRRLLHHLVADVEGYGALALFPTLLPLIVAEK